ncbi:MAG: hypothetical protein D6737_05105 [Chloroflexi bacterium]|nr:MAG: hypothetical protein CUN54_01930 [Phototrophicales bacterium]RMF81367.1 MAG: hypothetical protein D6737_05105 [Chloroflexota bacterium]
MAWRLHLTNQAIQRLDILPNTQSLLAIWLRQDRVVYHDLASGVAVGEQTLEMFKAADRKSNTWHELLNELVVPNGVYLPVVDAGYAVIYLTDDGQMRLYDYGNGELALEIEGKEIPLDIDGQSPLAIALDRFLGLVAILDEDAKLRIFQQHISVGVFDFGLERDAYLRPTIAISRGGSVIFCSDGKRIAVTDSGGKLLKMLETHHTIGQIACSSSGRRVATSDPDTGVIRVYDGNDLAATHQRHAIDLMADARQVQLMAELPPAGVALRGLNIDDDGVIAFAMSGVVCVTDIHVMDELPRPQPLL